MLAHCGCAAAYATHLVLDLHAVDRTPPQGIQLLWPFSRDWIISSWEIFPRTERQHLLSLLAFRTNAWAAFMEVAILTPILIGLWLVRVKTLAGLSTKLARSDHPAE